MNSKSNFFKWSKFQFYLFQKISQKFGVFCALEALNGAWECDFMSLPAFLLVLTLRILLKNWSFLSCGSGATLGISRAIQTRREEDGAREELELQEFERERETFILRSAQLLRGTGDYRWIFHDRKDYALEFFALYLSDFFVHTACYTDQICYCSKYGNLIQSHICKGVENDKMSRWFLENQQKMKKKALGGVLLFKVSIFS